MSPNHPAWGAVREAARRILRHEKVRISLPHATIQAGHRLVDRIMDADPRRTDLPTVHLGDTCEVYADQTLVVSWTNGRSLDTLLMTTEGDAAATMMHVLGMAHDLVDAGYPGCLGCGGPGLEEPWDEVHWRLLH